MQNTATAILRKVRVSPQKLNIVAAMIRGMKADKAVRMKMAVCCFPSEIG